MGAEHDRIKRNKRHKYQKNRYVEGYVPTDVPRTVEQRLGDIIISNPIIRPEVIRPIGLNYIQTVTPIATTSIGDLATNDVLDKAPTPGTNVLIAVNGRVVVPANGASDIGNAAAWIESPDGVVRKHGEAQIGDRIKWNGACAGIEIEPDDEFILVYEVNDGLENPPAGTNYIQEVTPLVTTADGDLASNDTLDKQPTAGTTVIIALNGRVIVPADGPGDTNNAAAWIESPGGVIRAHGAAQLGDFVKWNGTFAGTQIEADDELIYMYEID